MRFSSLEICAGAGGEALGLEMAGFEHLALVEYEKEYCECLKMNRPGWNVINMDVRIFDGKPYRGRIDLLSGGVPCPPFSIAGKQLGENDDRDLFPEMLRLVDEIRPKAVMIENVRGLLGSTFDAYRSSILRRLSLLGYRTSIKLLNASGFGVPQSRPRVFIVGIRRDIPGAFTFPIEDFTQTPSVGEVLYDLMNSKGWAMADDWRKTANGIAPTIVGGSKKHGGPDLGPTRARKAWADLGIDGKGVADEAPEPDFIGLPRLTPRMLARIQGFPDEWSFGNIKTKACRMIGNALPPPVAMAVGNEIHKLLYHEERVNFSRQAGIPQEAAV